jgi:hypothetical protein
MAGILDNNVYAPLAPSPPEDMEGDDSLLDYEPSDTERPVEPEQPDAPAGGPPPHSKHIKAVSQATSHQLAYQLS